MISSSRVAHCAIGTVVWQTDIGEAHQAHGQQLQPPRGAERAPQQERLAFHVVVDQKRDHCCAGWVFHACNLARSFARSGVGDVAGRLARCSCTRLSQ